MGNKKNSPNLVAWYSLLLGVSIYIGQIIIHITNIDDTLKTNYQDIQKLKKQVKELEYKQIHNNSEINKIITQYKYEITNLKKCCDYQKNIKHF